MPTNLSSEKLSSGTVIYRSTKPEAEYTIDSALKSKNNFVYRIKIKSGAGQEKDAVAKWTSHDVSTAQRTTREQAIDREIEILATLRHPSIVRILSIHPNNTAIKAPYWATSHLDQVGKFFVTEYLPYNSLSDSYRKQEYQKDLVWIVKTFSAILDAVKLAHGQGIIHLDIKPGNILFRSLDAQGKPSNPVLIDWGGARYLKDNLIGQQYSEGYYAPERETSASPDPKMDVWALGGVLYAMLTGRIPDDKDLALSEKIEVRKSKILYELRDLVRKMRLVDPTVRFSISEVQESLRRLKPSAAIEQAASAPKERLLDKLSKTLNSLWVFATIVTCIVILILMKVNRNASPGLQSSIAITPTSIPTVGMSPTPMITNTMEVSPTVIQEVVADFTPTPTLAPPPSIAVITPTTEPYYCPNECPTSNFANITWPCKGTTVSGIVYVKGTSTFPASNDLAFDKYKFEYRYVESYMLCPTPDSAGYCQIGPDFKKPVINSSLGWFDTTSISDGQIDIRLSTVKTDSNYESCVIRLIVQNR